MVICGNIYLFFAKLIDFHWHGTHYGLAAFGIYCFIISYAGFLPSINLYRLENLLYAMNSFIKLPKETIRTWYSSELENLFKLRRDFVIFSFLGPSSCFKLNSCYKVLSISKAMVWNSSFKYKRNNCICYLVLSSFSSCFICLWCGFSD